ncbi:MAG: NUDIX domain-containing protein [Patescibacteria group bacterium]|nr:NUDIX domain-containing protein [Patescibacteria group bacterium]MDD4610340.1 NUDIX domain-containing protein [Patescibacteria group bacterium]
MEKKSKLVVLGLVENQNHEYLLSQRYDPDVPEAHLKWDLPGGTNEFGESLEETLEREMLEETGLKIAIIKMFPKSISHLWNHKDFKQHAIVVCYYCKMLDVTLHLNDHKIQDLKWVQFSELDMYDFLPTTKCFIEILVKNNFLP